MKQKVRDLASPDEVACTDSTQTPRHGLCEQSLSIFRESLPPTTRSRREQMSRSWLMAEGVTKAVTDATDGG
jgi:hypothetical protein